jgi:CheY-like chemotaxis protein
MKADSQRILCADDNPYFRYFVSQFLTGSGYEVAETATASEALSMVRERPDHYDLLIVADWLPDMDGVELFQTLRAIPYTGRIVVTAPELSPDKKASYESLGASSFLMTPIGYSDILRILKPPATVGAGEHQPDQHDDTNSSRAPDSSSP